MILTRLKSLFFLLLAMVFATSTHSESVRVGHVEIELVSEVTSVKPGVPFTIALRIITDEEWHVYWVNPGDAGLPPKIKWSNQSGVTIGPIQYPYPEKIVYGPLASFGYEGEVLYPMTVTLDGGSVTGDSVTLSGEASWLVCKEECIPGKTTLSLTLPVSSATPVFHDLWSKKINATRFNLPIVLPDWKVESFATEKELSVVVTPPAGFELDTTGIIFFPESEDLIQAAPPQKITKSGKSILITSLRNLITKDLPDSINGIIVNERGWRGEGSEHSFSFRAALRNGPPSMASPTAAAGTVALNFLFALVGGLILNLMPCVLPVLSLKIFGFVAQAGEDKKKVIQHGLSFTAGVLISFWILAGILIALRAGGEQIGWGFQLQSPVFVALTACFMFLFGLNLLGVFEVGTSLTTLAGAGGGHQGLSGSFVNGVTATIVATPCTAPFMGSALGFALSQPAYVSLLIFTGIGLGMALPYLILSAWPGLLKFVPKPGRWMESLKQFMGFLLFATVIYLAFVLGAQTGADGLLWLMGVMLILGIAGWIYGRWGHFSASGRAKFTSSSLALVLLAMSVWLVSTRIESAPQSESSSTTSGDGLQWERYSKGSLDSYLANGTPVFLDFTAAWCLSCKVNEKTSLSSKAVADEFKKRGIVTMMADWTNRDDEITAALANFGRNSVPLYVLYDGTSSSPTLLPEILTESIVLNAIAKIDVN